MNLEIGIFIIKYSDSFLCRSYNIKSFLPCLYLIDTNDQDNDQQNNADAAADNEATSFLVGYIFGSKENEINCGKVIKGTDSDNERQHDLDNVIKGLAALKDIGIGADMHPNHSDKKLQIKPKRSYFLRDRRSYFLRDRKGGETGQFLHLLRDRRGLKVRSSHFLRDGKGYQAQNHFLRDRRSGYLMASNQKSLIRRAARNSRIKSHFLRDRKST